MLGCITVQRVCNIWLCRSSCSSSSTPACEAGTSPDTKDTLPVKMEPNQTVLNYNISTGRLLIVAFSSKLNWSQMSRLCKVTDLLCSCDITWRSGSFLKGHSSFLLNDSCSFCHFSQQNNVSVAQCRSVQPSGVVSHNLLLGITFAKI